MITRTNGEIKWVEEWTWSIGIKVDAHAQEIFEISYVNKLQQQRFQTKVSILIVDSKACLVKDLKEYDSKNNGPDDEVLPFARINFW